jgi:hypothetical protein
MTALSRAAWLCACVMFSFEIGLFYCKVKDGKRRCCVRQKLHIGTVSEVQVTT